MAGRGRSRRSKSRYFFFLLLFHSCSIAVVLIMLPAQDSLTRTAGNTALFDLESQDGPSTPLLMLGLEYYFKYNIGSGVSFDTTWGPCCCGTVLYSKISEASRGTACPIGEIGYNYYIPKKASRCPTQSCG
jgi:hypothetical protein